MDFFNKASIFAFVRNFFICFVILIVATSIVAQFVHIPFETLIEMVTTIAFIAVLIPTLIHRLEILLIEKLKWLRLAVGLCNLAILCNRGDIWSYINRSYAYLVLRENEKALKDGNDAIFYGPEIAMAYNNRGAAQKELKRYDQALSDFNSAIELNSSFALAYRNRITLYTLLKKYELAEQDIQRLREIQLPDANSLFSIGTAYLFMGKHQEALQNFNQAIATKPTHADSYHNRGCIYLHLNEVEKAGPDFLKAQELAPGEVVHGLMVEWYRLCFQGPDEAMAQRLQEYIRRDMGGDTGAIYLCHGITHWLQGQYEEALVSFEQTLEQVVNKDDSDSYFWAGMACAALGRDDEAIAAFEHARKEGLPSCLFQTITLLEQKRPDFVASLRSEQPAP